MNGQLRIDQMYAFVATDKDGTEGIVGAATANGWMPLVGADMERVDQLRPLVKEIAKATNVTVRLLRFSVREELEVITP